MKFLEPLAQSDFIREIMLKLLKIALATTLFSSICTAGNLYEKFPKQIKANEKYVFYSHGFIVEGDNPMPVNPHWGMYDFPKIKELLADEKYNLIAYHRPKDTDPKEFAKKLANDIKMLADQGVKYENITLIGFSRGGAITVLTSHYVQSDKMKSIILAGCGKFEKSNTDVKVHGNIYSIFETSDGVGSCQYLINRSEKVKSFEEIAISTGKGHGAFYNPLPEWVEPVKKWILSD